MKNKQSNFLKGAGKITCTRCEIFKPITRRSNRNGVIPYDIHLKAALTTIHRQLLKQQGPSYN